MVAINYFSCHPLQELTLKFYVLGSPSWPTACQSRPGFKFYLSLTCWTLGNLSSLSGLHFPLPKLYDEGSHPSNLLGGLNEVIFEKMWGTDLYQILPTVVFEKFLSLGFHDNRHSRFSSYLWLFLPSVSVLPYTPLTSWCALRFCLRHSLVRGDFTASSPRLQVPAATSAQISLLEIHMFTGTV